MATFQQIVNPDSALKEVADYRTFKTTSGEKLALGSTTREYLAGAAIPIGRVVCLNTPASATAKALVTEKATARFYSSVVGVTESVTTASGQVVRVVVEGLAFVDVGAGTPAGGNGATVQANSGQAGVQAAESDATTIVGTVLGHFLGAKDTANLAPVIVSRQ